MFTFYVLCCFAACDHEPGHTGPVTHSVILIKYNDSKTGEPVVSSEEYGHYGTKSRIAGESGVLVHVRSINNVTEGCDLIDPVIVPQKKWIALIKRGNCSFNSKIYFATKKSNASAVVLYNNQSKPRPQDKQEHDIVIPETSGAYNGRYEQMLWMKRDVKPEVCIQS